MLSLFCLVADLGFDVVPASSRFVNLTKLSET